jgi:hypothetical protein
MNVKKCCEGDQYHWVQVWNMYEDWKNASRLDNRFR